VRCRQVGKWKLDQSNNNSNKSKCDDLKVVFMIGRAAKCMGGKSVAEHIHDSLRYRLPALYLNRACGGDISWMYRAGRADARKHQWLSPSLAN